MTKGYNKKTKEQVMEDMVETVGGFNQLQSVFERMIQTDEFKQMQAVKIKAAKGKEVLSNSPIF